MLDFTKYQFGDTYEKFRQEYKELGEFVNVFVNFYPDSTFEDTELLRAGVWQAQIELSQNYANILKLEALALIKVFKVDVLDDLGLRYAPREVTDKMFDIAGIDDMDFETIYSKFQVQLEVVKLVLKYTHDWRKIFMQNVA